ncbi:MAG: dehydrogenase [Phycisphaerae bacterium]
MSDSVTRRKFLEQSTKLAGAAAALSSAAGCGQEGGGMTRAGAGPSARTVRRAVGANEKFNVALIGCGGMGSYKLTNFMNTRQCNLAALCDVDESHLADKHFEGHVKGSEALKAALEAGPARVKDYRAVCDRKDIDLVIVATPDHWHAAPMMLAVASGKDVYCEKPCCHNVREGVLMLKAARKYGAVVQVGTHQRQIPHIQEARRFIQEGGLGTISMTNTYTYGNEVLKHLGHAPDGPPPPGVDYELWLGPAPKRPFNPRRFHNTWRWYFDYASGMVGDWNVHLQDIIMWTMGVTAPVSVSCIGGHWVLDDDRTTPDTMVATYEFGPARNAPKGFVQTYTMRKASGKPWDAGGYGMDFHGANGMIHLTRTDYITEPDKWDWKSWDPVAKRGMLGPNGSEWRLGDMTKEQKNRVDPGADQAAHMKHVENFLECVRTRSQPLAGIESHYHTVVACHLANVSLRCGGRRLYWDADQALCFSDPAHKSPDREANRLLSREYRKGYELPEV